MGKHKKNTFQLLDYQYFITQTEKPTGYDDGLHIVLPFKMNMIRTGKGTVRANQVVEWTTGIGFSVFKKDSRINISLPCVDSMTDEDRRINSSVS